MNVWIAESIGTQESSAAQYERALNIFRIIFISRISSKSNLVIVLEGLRKVCNPMIYYLAEDKIYWEQCQKAIKSLPDQIPVSNEDTLQQSGVIETMSGYNASICLLIVNTSTITLQNVFCAGLPVLTSGTNPQRNLQEKDISWDFPINNTDAFSTVLDKLAVMSPDRRYHMSINMLA